MKLKELTETSVTYFYFPEGKEPFGEIRMDFNADKPVIITQANNYVACTYTNHALNAVKQCVEENDFPEEFTNAWY